MTGVTPPFEWEARASQRIVEVVGHSTANDEGAGGRQRISRGPEINRFSCEPCPRPRATFAFGSNAGGTKVACGRRIDASLREEVYRKYTLKVFKNLLKIKLLFIVF